MPIGYHAVFDPDFLDAIGYAADQGFDYVQFDLNVPRFFLDHLTSAEVNSIGQAARDRGVGIGLHAPGDNVSLFTDYPAIREGILGQLGVILERAGELGALHLTVHPGSPPSFRKTGETDDSFRREHRRYYETVLSENLRRLAGLAGGVPIAVENVGLVSSSFAVVEPLLGARSPICLCWDLAKSQSQPEAEAFYRRNLPHLREIHVHDLDARGRQHEGVGSGGVPFARYLDVLRRPDVAITIEVRPREAAVESRDRLVRLLRST